MRSFVFFIDWTLLNKKKINPIIIELDDTENLFCQQICSFFLMKPCKFAIYIYIYVNGLPQFIDARFIIRVLNNLLTKILLF